MLIAEGPIWQEGADMTTACFPSETNMCTQDTAVRVRAEITGGVADPDSGGPRGLRRRNGELQQTKKQDKTQR